MSSLDELEALLGAATPGPAFCNYNAIYSEPLTAARNAAEAALPEDASDEAYDALLESLIASVPTAGGDTPTSQAAKDASFIAAIYSAAPALIAELRAGRERVAELEKQLMHARALLDGACS